MDLLIFNNLKTDVRRLAVFTNHYSFHRKLSLFRQAYVDCIWYCGIVLQRKRFVELTEAVMVMEGAFQAGTYQPSVISKSLLPQRLHHV